ncbi:VWA domain-containing protein [Sulfidibacter corallicola]|uniref:VWA domain-containing protein n=1 Tax=Sulfidibacter corallicola TaxID=2818388 RepID=A0A8A4TVX6_SULCO|nr:VWA domain-containing protein [Sulfidibacter corallicola]QTD53284.1 VWA domain-containing protein [Sulfidibacter corallicola]
MLVMLLSACLAAGKLQFIEPVGERFAGMTRFHLTCDVPDDEILGLEVFVNGQSVHYFESPPFETELDLSRFPEGELHIRAVLSRFSGKDLVAERKGQNHPHFFEEDVRLIQVPVKVAFSGEVRELKAEDFQLRENGVPQKLTYLLSEEHPLHLVLAVDYSGSMESRLPVLVRGIWQLLDQLKEHDRVQMIGFNHRVFEVFETDTDKEALRTRLLRIRADGATNLYGGVWSGVKLLSQSNLRRALVVFTDGKHDLDGEEDVYGKGLKDCVDLASRAGVPIYTMGVGSSVDPDVLQELSMLSGGKSFVLKSSQQIRKAFAVVGHELRHQYLLCYHTRSTFSGWHDIEVKIQADAGLLRYPQRLYFQQ